MQHTRQVNEQPSVICKEGWRFHHLGVPTTISHPDEQYVPHLKIHVSGFDSSPYGIEWMRFDPDCQISELIKTVPHIAFEVDDLNEAIIGKNLIGEVTSPSEGVRVAMIVDDGAPIELIEFHKSINK